MTTAFVPYAVPPLVPTSHAAHGMWPRLDVSQSISTHNMGLGMPGSAYAESTPQRSRLESVLQHFHVVAMIKRLLKSRERCILPMDCSGL